MKSLVALLVLCAIFITACSAKPAAPANSMTTVKPDIQSKQSEPKSTEQTSTEKTDTAVTAEKVSDYFPLIKDVHLKYKGAGNEYAAYDTYVDYVKDGVMQVRNSNGGTILALVYKLEGGAIKKVFSREETYYRYDYTSSSNQDEIIIKEPIKAGTTWALKDGQTRTITAVDKQIKVPAGSFKALEVTTQGKDYTVKNYYVKGIGQVKSEFKSGNGSNTVTSELEKQENGVPYKHTARFYFPDFSNDRVVYIDREVEINTNQDMKFKFQKELKTIPENSGLAKVLSANTSVLGASIDEANGIVTVDFSSQLVKEMNAGTAFENMLLKSITNTFGGYYQKDKVIITIEGKPYESGHILMKKDEYFKVDKTNVVEYKKAS